MHIIPVSVIDNFLSNPNSIRNWALRQEFFPDPNGQWPGQRTKLLSEINPELANLISCKYFNLFFNLYDNHRWIMDLQFQIVTGDVGQGWIHQDSHARLTGIIYLTPNAILESGTSIYQQKDDSSFPNVAKLNNTKVQHYLGNITNDEANADRILLKEYYNETIRINNVYNRLVTFDAHLPHAAHDYCGDALDDSRLTLVMFVKQLYADQTPISRSKIIL
jgi:hypothetical protein